MLNKLIPHIDQSIAELKYFDTIYGLAEQVTDSGEKGEKYPAVFKGADNYTQIDLEKLACYHRIAGERSFIQLQGEDVIGCAKAFEMTYPMVFVGCVNYSPGCETYETDSIANSVANKLYQVPFNKTIRSEVKVFSIELWIKEILTDRVKIWDEEYENVEPSMTFDKIYFSIKYDLRIKGTSSCLNIIQC